MKKSGHRPVYTNGIARSVPFDAILKIESVTFLYTLVVFKKEMAV